VTNRPSPIEAARERHRLADVARRAAIFLPTTAGTVTVRCPMPAHGHPDHTPSMRLYLDDDRYYCFGCGAKGDVIQWVRDTEGLGVTDALRCLDSGRTITNAWAGRSFDDHRAPAPTGNRAQPGQAEYPDLSRTSHERVTAALKDAWAFYSTPALHRQGSDYLASRGIDIGVLEERNGRLEVGHTPPGPAALVTALRTAGYDDDELVDAGLAQRYHPQGRLTDFYRERVLIPIHGEHGGVDGLVGRNVGHNRYPKYKNPPRTRSYDKSVNLYQPLPAPAHPASRVVIVEGTLDAMAIAVASLSLDRPGRIHPVTQSGRELSATQMRRILDMHPRPPVLGFDGDEAGVDSANRYVLAFARLGTTPLISVLPHDHDPASWLAATGPDGLAVWEDVNGLAAFQAGRDAFPAAAPAAGLSAG
jgi:DNA primase